MENSANYHFTKQMNPNFVLLAFLVTVFIGMSVYLSWQENGVFYQMDKPCISHLELEENYGLKVKLIRLSTDRKNIDFHLEVVDPKKAGLLLEDPDVIPGLWIEETGSHLMTVEADRSIMDLIAGRIIKYELVNLDNVVQVGTPVLVVFGNLFVEPIPVE